jgi:2-methylisocitrate lyase-like PEP mutase family enzyme
MQASSTVTLLERLKQTEILIAPGVYDALGAGIAEQAGFEALYLSGASLAYSRLGGPDIGLLGLSEVSDSLRHIRERTRAWLLVDADTGFGNAINVMRTVRVLEAAGANAIQLEDQDFPKRCGHLKGKSLVSCQEMVGKIRAACDARHSQATLIIGRTDAVAVEGLELAMVRAERYVEAGADVLFVEGLRSTEQMLQVLSRFAHRVPVLVNMVEGGDTPLQSAAVLQSMGFSLVIFPGALARAFGRMAQTFFASLKHHGSTDPFRPHMLDFTELNALLDTPAILARGQRYSPESVTSTHSTSKESP